MENKTKSKFYSLLIFSLIFLLNPNINVVDILPDFVAWFILARLFERAADSAPYFEEARAGFIKLGYVNLCKILGLFLIILVKGNDTSDNNIFALVSFSFCAVELLFLIPTVKNIFTALFHLGERTDARALISPLNATKPNETGSFLHCIFSAESVKDFTYLFFICKCALYTIPDMFLLTRETEKGYFVNFSSAYPIVLVSTIVLGIALGLLWFNRIKKYVNLVMLEGKFFEALDSMRAEDNFGKYELRTRLRSIGTFLTVFSIASIFTLQIKFSNFSDINILPTFVFVALMIIAVFLSRKHTVNHNPCYVSGALAFIVSIVNYIITVVFLSSYTYEDIKEIPSASTLYLIIEILSIIEMLLVIVFLFFIMKMMNTFVLDYTGVDPKSDRYSSMEREFHGTLMRKNLIIFIFGALTALVKCIDAFLNGSVILIFTNTNDVTAGAFYAPSIPWFGLVVTVSAVLYIFFSFYYLSTLKDEVKMRFSI